MIIPGNTLLALLSSPQESQGTGEEGGFGALLTEIEQHTTSLPDHEEAERRALESVLQALMSLFQSCIPANLLPVATAPGTGESGFVSMRPVGGLPLGLPPGRDTASALRGTGEVNLPSGMVLDGAQDIGQLAFPALDGQSTGSSPVTAGALENFTWLLHRQESMQDLSGLFTAEPTAALSVSTPTAELSPLSGAPLPAPTPAFSRDSALTTVEAQLVTPVANQDAGNSLSGAVLPLPPGASFPAFLHLHAQDDGLWQTATELPAPRLSPPSLPFPATASAEGAQLNVPPSPTREEGEKVAAVAVGEQGRGESNLTPPLVGPALGAQPLVAGEEVFQSPHTALQPAPGHAAPAAPWAVPATTPLTETAIPLPTIPPTEGAVASAALRPRALAQEDTALPEYDTAPVSRHLPESQERAAEAMPSVAPLATDSALPPSSARATSHTPSAEPAIAVPPSHSLEDMGRPWSRPLPANTVILQLEPRELGALLLQIRVNDKRLIASFQAQSPEAETLLRIHLPSLHESLSQHGFEVQPIVITRAAEGFSAHMESGTGGFAHQHSAFQAFTEDRQAANAGETQSDVDLHRTPRWPSEQRRRLLDVVI